MWLFVDFPTVSFESPGPMTGDTGCVLPKSPRYQDGDAVTHITGTAPTAGDTGAE